MEDMGGLAPPLGFVATDYATLIWGGLDPVFDAAPLSTSRPCATASMAGWRATP